MVLKRKHWWSKWGQSAPKMAVKPQLPLPLKLAAGFLAVALGGAMALWIFDRGRDLTGFNPKDSQKQLQLYNGV